MGMYYRLPTAAPPCTRTRAQQAKVKANCLRYPISHITYNRTPHHRSTCPPCLPPAVPDNTSSHYTSPIAHLITDYCVRGSRFEQTQRQRTKVKERGYGKLRTACSGSSGATGAPGAGAASSARARVSSFASSSSGTPDTCWLLLIFFNTRPGSWMRAS
jgi:hypothetical protein